MRRIRFLALAALCAGAPALGQQRLPTYDVVDYPLHSGRHSGSGDEHRLVFEAHVVVPDAIWSKLEFAAADLGQASTLSLMSLADGGLQVLDAVAFEQWDHGSAIFNGDEVLLQLYAAPGDVGVYVELESVLAGQTVGPSFGISSLCGDDDRTASTDNRSGRLFFGGCTAWRVTNGAFLTAGHCVDFDPDQGGPLLPDGVVDLNGVVEFNVPSSSSSGGTVAADPDDQYAIDLTSVNWRFDGSGQGLGKDWGIFEVFANPNTGLLPHEAYGLPWRVTRDTPSGSGPLRVTGFGYDDSPAGSGGAGNSDSYTNQTSTGPYLGETNEAEGGISLEYQVDTDGGNSGSPVIWSLYGITIGIHTNAGCDSLSGNYGTSFELNELETALHTWPSGSTRYADVGHPYPVAEDGTVFRPFDTVAEAVDDVPSGGVVSVVEGTYSQAAGNAITVTKALTIEAPVGTVTIGS